MEDDKRRKKSLVDSLNTAYSNFRLARTAVAAAGALEGLGPILLIVFGCIFALMFLTGFTAGVPLGGGESESSNETSGSATIPKDASFCPIPNGIVTCGSKKTPINGCGHCNEDYINTYTGADVYCGVKGSENAMDIAGNANSPVFLPTINGKTISWTFGQERVGTVGFIQVYNGKAETGETYLISLHHTTQGSGILGRRISGDQGATICPTCNHVHVQLASGDPYQNPGDEYLDAPSYLCKSST